MDTSSPIRANPLANSCEQHLGVLLVRLVENATRKGRLTIVPNLGRSIVWKDAGEMKCRSPTRAIGATSGIGTDRCPKQRLRLVVPPSSGPHEAHEPVFVGG